MKTDIVCSIYIICCWSCFTWYIVLIMNKPRAWHINFQEMCPVYAIKWLEEGKHILLWDEKQSITCREEEVILMHPTRYSDKNYQIIWGGDIIKYQWHYYSVDSLLDWTAIVRWCYSDLRNIHYNSEVVWNIHENKSLLD